MRQQPGQLPLADGLVEGTGRNRQLAKIGVLIDRADRPSSGRHAT